MGIFDDVVDAVTGGGGDSSGGGGDSDSGGSGTNVSDIPSTPEPSAPDPPSGGVDLGPDDGSGTSASRDSGGGGSPNFGGGGGGGGSPNFGGGGGGGGSRRPPTQPDVDPVPVSTITDPVGDAVDTVTDPVEETVDFVTSGPDEPSVGDPEFSDPDTPEGDVPGGGGDPAPDIEPDTPDVGNELVTDDAAGNFTNVQLREARSELTADIQDQTPGIQVERTDLQLDVGDEPGTIVARPTDIARTQFTGPQIPAGGGDVPAVGDVPSAPQSTFSDVGEPDITADPGLIDDATDSGGLLAENRTDTSAVLPGQVGGVDISEEAVFGTASDAGQTVDERLTGTAAEAEVGPVSTPFGETVADAGGNIVAGLAESPRAIEGAAEFAQNAPLTQESVVTAGSTAVDVAQATARTAREEPATFASETVLSFGAGAVAGRTLGTAGRAARRSSTRVGGTKIDANELVNERTLRNFEGEIDDPDARFPGAADEDLFERDPAASVRQQADEFTPDEIEARFDAAGVDDATDLKKAVDRNPEGPAVGRGNTGFESQEGTFESPGAFAGPELSPNFLRLGDSRAEFSMRPGLPDFGSNPTGVVIRTDVESPDADTLDEFNQELLDAEGETTARTKPADVANPGETEAVIPPEAEFAPVRGGVGSRVRSRLGFGSDFFTEIDGQPVRLQPAADPDLVDGAPRRRLFGDGGDRGQATLPGQTGVDVGDTRRLSEIRRGGDVGTDRPLPAAPVSSPATSTAPSATVSGPFGTEFGTDIGFGGDTTSRVRDDRDSDTSRRDRTDTDTRSQPTSSPEVRPSSPFGSLLGFGSRVSGIPSGTTIPSSGSGRSPESTPSERIPSGGSGRSASGASSGASSSVGGSGAGGSGGVGSGPTGPTQSGPPQRPPRDRDDEPDRERLPVRDLDPVTPERANPIIGSLADITGQNRREDRRSDGEDPRGESGETGFLGIDAGVFGDFGGVGR